jgi:hypothetical protein
VAENNPENHDVTSQKTIILTTAAVRTWNDTQKRFAFSHTFITKYFLIFTRMHGNNTDLTC